MAEEVKEINKEIGGDDQYFTSYGEGEMHSKYGGKVKRGGVGGKDSKSMNFKQQKNANKRRIAKQQRADEKEEEQRIQRWAEY